VIHRQGDRRVVPVIAAMITLAFALAGCSDTPAEDDVVSVQRLASAPASASQTQAPADDAGEGPGTPSSARTNSAAKTQVERAEAAYSCLTDAGFPAIIEDMPTGESWVWIESDDTVIQVWEDGNNFFWSQGTWPLAEGPEAQDEYRAHMEAMTRAAKDSSFGYVVYVGDADRTADFGPCLAESGYEWPGLQWRDPEVQLAARRESAELANEWAACARANGVPGVLDAQVSEDLDLFPVALLPAGVTEAQIRGLLDACPPWDKEIEEANQEANLAGRTEDLRGQPSIGFDIEGYREQDEPGPSPEDKEIYQPLYDLLWSVRSSYYAAQPDADLG
jgi:hypothetical protein